MQAGHYSSLLPELFRHKTTRVRVFQPQVILLDFHGTISERRWEDKVIYPYVKQAVGNYLHDNWSLEMVQKCIPGLKNESFEQRFRHKYEDAPIIDDQQPGEDMDPAHLVNQLADFLQWQMTTKRETKETQIIERLVWQDGFRRRKILLPLYDDVASCFKRWHDQYNCNIYIISSLDVETLKLLFENTEKGNLDQYITGYVSSRKIGDKMISDTYKRFFDRLQLTNSNSKTLPPKKEDSGNRNNHKALDGSNSPKSPPLQQQQSNSLSSSSSSKIIRQQQQQAAAATGGPSLNPSTGSLIELIRPAMFLTDSGQEAKAASRVNDGNAFECILVNRPGNKRMRTYYLSQFQYVDNFGDIEFVSANQQ